MVWLFKNIKRNGGLERSPLLFLSVWKGGKLRGKRIENFRPIEFFIFYEIIFKENSPFLSQKIHRYTFFQVSLTFWDIFPDIFALIAISFGVDFAVSL